jgi:spermidine synthase
VKAELQKRIAMGGAIMNSSFLKRAVAFIVLLCGTFTLRAIVVFSAFSAYHHIEVIDEGGVRTLSFNGSMETRMFRELPLRGHFEYTEYFHMPWLWNTNMKRVLMVGLGGGSTQRSYQHYYTNVLVDTVELDPVVVSVAKNFFHVTETPTHKIYMNDGRVFLKRTTNVYDAIIMDAYATTRYGSSIPPHLTTKEFFMRASSHLTTNGVVAYNIIGQVQGWNADIVGALFRTMREVFPQVYLFPATETQNVVLIATRSAERFDAARVQKEAAALVRNQTVTHPLFAERLQSFSATPPATAARSPVLTDVRSGVEGLLR